MPWIALSLLSLVALVAVTAFETRRLEARFPPVGAFADVDGVRLHYSIAGPEDKGGATIVLLHGASTSLLDFHASLLPPLAERHRVIAMDRPGHGYSERARPTSGDWPDPSEQARLLHGLLAQLQVEQPVLVGHSWALERTGVELTLRPRTFLANAEDIRLLSPFLERQITHYDAIRRPLLLITGDTDGVVPAWNHAERLIHQAPFAQLVMLPGIGHGLHHVATERVVELIDDFARRVAR